MKNIVFVGAAALALAACGGENTTTSDVGNTADMAAGKVEDTAGQAVGMTTAPLANNAEAYVTNAAIGDMYEVASSRMALEKSQSPEIKQFAQKMIDDHTATTAQLKATLGEANVNVTPPQQMDDRRQGMINNLQNLSGEAFDTAYLDQQTAAHQEALTLHQSYAQDGDNAALKQFAAATAPKIQMHYDMVQKLDEAGADDR